MPELSLTDPAVRSVLHDHAVRRGIEGDLDEAARLLREVVRSSPEDPVAAKNLAIVLLSQGNYREGAPLYEARLSAPRKQFDPPIPYPRWSGEPLEGKRLLIWPEQGLGDQIMFARFIPNLIRSGCDVTLLCHPTLERLFKNNFASRVVGTYGTIEFPDPDLWIFSNSLMPALIRSEEDIPNQSYLKASPLSTPARIGVATRGSSDHENDAHRSLPQDLAAELLALSNATSLLPEDTGARDFSDTASLVASLDLVISVDTSVAHLAGAMGKPVWILLPASGTDWRWMRDRGDSPWYPTARLFRQPSPGDWRTVIDHIVSDLS